MAVMDQEQSINAPEAQKTGRPSSFTESRADRIIEALIDGTPLREVCRQNDMPAWRTVYDWMQKDDKLSAAIARARDVGTQAIAEDIVNLADAPPERDDRGRIDNGWVQLQKLKIETRLKLLAKWNPKMFGDRLDLGNADDKPFNITIAK